MMSRFLVLVFFITCVLTLTSYSQDYSKKYPWLNPQMDYIQFYERGDIDTLARKWKSTDNEKLVIVHFGDSHVQSDILTSQYRKIFQENLGKSGRGMIFPYSAASTYSSIEYKSHDEGEWEWAKSFIQPPKFPLGNTGMTIHTADSSASFSLKFSSPQDSVNKYLRIYCDQSSNAFDFDLFIDSTRFRINTDSNSKSGLPFIEIPIPVIEQSISFKIVKTDSTQNFFELYGLELVSHEDKGVTVHCVGVGASRFQSMLHQKLLYKQLPYLNPDLVILDFGTNDYLYKDIILKSLRGEITRIIDSVRKWTPETVILLTSTMDMSRKGRHRRSGVAFSELIHSIAKEKNCLMFDWFWIAGGRRVVRDWSDAGLSQPDLIHLSMKGYRLKGDLFAEAFKNTMDSLQINPNMDSLVFSRDSLIALEKVIVYDLNNGFWHEIRSGESLGVIAQKYHVTVAELMEWNDLSSTKIIAGKQLWIGRKKK